MFSFVSLGEYCKRMHLIKRFNEGAQYIDFISGTERGVRVSAYHHDYPRFSRAAKSPLPPALVKRVQVEQWVKVILDL